jgi:hypothetical protein
MAGSDTPSSVPEATGDKYRVEIDFPDRAAAGRLVRDRGLDLIHQAPSGDGVRATFLLTRAEIEALRAEGLELAVGENASATGRQRQEEVGSGDRFEGGRVVPRSRNLAPPRER